MVTLDEPVVFKAYQAVQYGELCRVQIFDQFVPCLKDVNGKVTLMALSVLCDILPCVGPHMSNVVSLTVATVASNLASSSREIHDAASQALDQLILLVGMFSHYFLCFSMFDALWLLLVHPYLSV